MENKTIGWVILLGVIILLLAIAGGMVGCPNYDIYVKTCEGKAMLAHATSAKEVAVAEAKAKMESAELLAQAEIARAGGVAKANMIIGESLKSNEAYLRYLWVNNLEGMQNKTVIYIPTEAGMPILEAGRSHSLDK